MIHNKPVNTTLIPRSPPCTMRVTLYYFLASLGNPCWRSFLRRGTPSSHWRVGIEKVSFVLSYPSRCNCTPPILKSRDHILRPPPQLPCPSSSPSVEHPTMLRSTSINRARLWAWARRSRQSWRITSIDITVVWVCVINPQRALPMGGCGTRRRQPEGASDNYVQAQIWAGKPFPTPIAGRGPIAGGPGCGRGRASQAADRRVITKQSRARRSSYQVSVRLALRMEG